MGGKGGHGIHCYNFYTGIGFSQYVDVPPNYKIHYMQWARVGVPVGSGKATGLTNYAFSA